MKKMLILLSSVILTLSASGQITIAEQDFDAVNTLNYTISPATYNTSGDVWAIVSDFSSNIVAGNPGDFWGMQDLNNSNGGGSFNHELNFSSVDISAYLNVDLSFHYNVVGYDSGDTLFYELSYDGVSQGVVAILGGTGSSSADWDTLSLSIPNTVSNLELTLLATQNGGSDYAGFDNIKIEGAPAGAGCNILSSGLTNIQCNDNGTPNIETDDYITFDLDPTGLNLGANYTVSAGTSISPATAVAFGSVSSFSTTPGTAGAGDITITITDDVDATCTLTETVTDPGVCSSAIPDIILSTSSLTDLDYTLNFTTEELSFDIEGITLTDDIVITAPANYLISETTGGPYLSTITLAQTAGAVANTTIYVTGNASTGGIYVEDIIATTNGGLNDTVEVAGEVLFHTPYTIDQITTVDANGVADSLDVLAELHGVMHCIDLDGNAGYNLVMIDESGSGVTLFDFSDQVTYTNPVEGDSLKVFGFISQFNGLTQFRPDSIALLAQNATLEMPTVVTTLDESTESQYITLENVSLVTPIATWNNGSSNYDITDGTNIFTLRVDSDTDIPGTAAPQGPFNVTGIGGQFDNSAPYDDGYQILPCGIASIVPLCSEVTNTITESACAGFDFNGTSITATGMYVDTLMSAAGCDSIVTLDFTLLTVDATITFASGEMTANAVGATYEWFDCITGLSIAGETAQTFVPTMNGSYGVYVTENGCTDTSACEVVANVGLEVNPLNNVNVYPNPVTKTLTVDLANLQNVSVRVLDVNGREVYNNTLASNTANISAATWQNGVYFVTLINGENKRVIKVVK